MFIAKAEKWSNNFQIKWTQRDNWNFLCLITPDLLSEQRTVGKSFLLNQVKKKGQQPFPCETTTHYFHWKKVHLLSPWLLYFLGLYQMYCQLWQMVFRSTWATTVIQIPRRAFHLLFICIPISFRLLAKLFFLICHFHSSGVAKEKQTVYKLNANHLWIEECVNVSGLF